MSIPDQVTKRERLVRLLLECARLVPNSTHWLLVALGYPDAFVPAALANPAIQDNIRDYPGVWSEDKIRCSPPMRWEFTHVTAWGGPEVISWAKNKGWGDLLSVDPLQPEDPVNPIFLQCEHKPSSPFGKRKNQRDWLKKKLGRKHRPLVSRAMRETKRNFVGALTDGWTTSLHMENSTEMSDVTIAKSDRKEIAKTMPDGRRVWRCWLHSEPENDKARVIHDKLRMHPGEFWTASRGNRILTAEERCRATGMLFDKG